MRYSDQSDPRYEAMQFDVKDHEHDLLSSLIHGDITCIVDEQEGGIIAYALDNHANKIVDALMKGEPNDN